MAPSRSSAALLPKPKSEASRLLIEALHMPSATGEDAAAWESWQIDLIDRLMLKAFTCDTKSRQVGWSWTVSAAYAAKGILIPRRTVVFTSLNMEESKQKIRYARSVIDAMHPRFRPRLVTDRASELEFENGSRLISHPCTAARGVPRADLVLDEFAHYQRAQEVYTGSLPAMTRGGSCHIGSSAWAKGGMHWEIATEEVRPYPMYDRMLIPWWLSNVMCVDVVTATRKAEPMLTEERVRAFGTERLQAIFDSLPLEDFQQEYECAFTDEHLTWISWELIAQNTDPVGDLQFFQADVSGEHEADKAFEAIGDLAEAIKDRKIRGPLYGGFDIGRKRNTSELVLLSKMEGGKLPYRLGISMFNMPFHVQEAVMNAAIDFLPLTKVFIDRYGIGMQMAESLVKRHPSVADNAEFTPANKELWATRSLKEFENERYILPADRELQRHLHSLKRTITAAKNAVFDVERSERHHADKAWALFLATWAAVGANSGRLPPKKEQDRKVRPLTAGLMTKEF